MGSYVAFRIVDCPDKRYFFLTKRCIDVVFASASLVLLSPLLILIAILIKLDSAGPVLFIQKRIGCRRCVDGDRTTWQIEPFMMLKFRSMITGADQTEHQEYIRAYTQGCAELSDEHCYKLDRDARITRLGHFIRRTSLDELPQLVNVLRGEMSLIGPRPVPDYEFETYKEEHIERMTSWPGMTGLWQVRGRCANSFEKQIELDIEYVRNLSPWLETKIFILTIPAVLSGRGAG